MSGEKLFMILLGCTPSGRNTEQHDVFFGIGKDLKDLLPSIIQSWPEAKGKLHIDAWREVTRVDGHSIVVAERSEKKPAPAATGAATGRTKLFFINLGGYKENEFEEFHYKMLIVAGSIDEAKSKAKKAIFYKQTSLEDSAAHHTATSHIDDKYGIDVDDAYNIHDILPASAKEKYAIRIAEQEGPADVYNLGYLKLDEI